MAKNYPWGALSAFVCVSLLVCVGFWIMKPVAFASKTSPDGAWSVTLWKKPSYQAWAEVHDNGLDRTERVDLGWFDDWGEPDWDYSKIVIDGDTAMLGSPKEYDRGEGRSSSWIHKRIVRSEVFAEKPPRYSGEFEAVSDFPETIQIVGWSDAFGPGRRPPHGKIAPGITYGSRYNWLKQVPDSISVEWYPESDPGNHRQQTISLAGVIPLGQKGLTAFRVDRDGKWRDRFVPADLGANGR